VHFLLQISPIIFGGEEGGGDGTSDEHCSASVRCAAAQLPVLLANEDTNQQRSSVPSSASYFFQVLPLISLSLFVSKVLYQSITF
jgi:hypothetical protein